jgi:preprotein translocase subunit SecG
MQTDSGTGSGSGTGTGTGTVTVTAITVRRALVVGIGWLVALGIATAIWFGLIYGALEGWRHVGR